MHCCNIMVEFVESTMNRGNSKGRWSTQITLQDSAGPNFDKFTMVCERRWSMLTQDGQFTMRHPRAHIERRRPSPRHRLLCVQIPGEDRLEPPWWTSIRSRQDLVCDEPRSGGSIGEQAANKIAFQSPRTGGGDGGTERCVVQMEVAQTFPTRSHLRSCCLALGEPAWRSWKSSSGQVADRETWRPCHRPAVHWQGACSCLPWGKGDHCQLWSAWGGARRIACFPGAPADNSWVARTPWTASWSKAWSVRRLVSIAGLVEHRRSGGFPMGAKPEGGGPGKPGCHRTQPSTLPHRMLQDFWRTALLQIPSRQHTALPGTVTSRRITERWDISHKT